MTLKCRRPLSLLLLLWLLLRLPLLLPLSGAARHL
jgi:hypothetical protein